MANAGRPGQQSWWCGNNSISSVTALVCVCVLLVYRAAMTNCCALACCYLLGCCCQAAGQPHRKTQACVRQCVLEMSNFSVNEASHEHSPLLFTLPALVLRRSRKVTYTWSSLMDVNLQICHLNERKSISTQVWWVRKHLWEFIQESRSSFSNHPPPHFLQFNRLTVLFQHCHHFCCLLISTTPVDLNLRTCGCGLLIDIRWSVVLRITCDRWNLHTRL